MNLDTGFEIRAAKIIFYTDKGDTVVYKMGDPDSKKALLVMVEVDTETDDVYHDTMYPMMQMVTNLHTKITIST